MRSDCFKNCAPLSVAIFDRFKRCETGFYEQLDAALMTKTSNVAAENGAGSRHQQATGAYKFAFKFHRFLKHERVGLESAAFGTMRSLGHGSATRFAILLISALHPLA
jgi:hypothetical protein